LITLNKPSKSSPQHPPAPRRVELDPFLAQQRPLLGQRDPLAVAPGDLAFETA
jgi:hypothetical protein